MADQDTTPLDKSRREFLRNVSLAATGAMLTGGLHSCAEPEDAEMLVGSLAQLRESGFLSPKFNKKRIFTTELEGEIVTFSMVCRHKRCTVDWVPEASEFQCPCHEGVYDAQGKVLDGPPPGPLFRFKTEVRGEEIWVMNEYLPG